jgi:hypothetical protein
VTTFDNKPSSFSLGTDTTFVAASGTTAVVCTASATTTLAPSFTVDEVPFNVNATGTAGNSFFFLEALASQEEVRVVHVVLSFQGGFEE